MNWVILSLITAFSVASQDTWVKKFFSDYNPYEMSVIPMLFSLPILCSALFFIEWPEIDTVFIVCFIASLPLNALSILLYMNAIRRSPLSLTLPYLAFSPAFMIITEFLLMDILPDKTGIAGLIIICTGAYILNLNGSIKDLSKPLKALKHEKGAVRMIGVALLFSIAAPVGKKAIIHSSPEFFSITFFIVLTLFMISLFFPKISLKKSVNKPLKGFMAGLLFTCHILFHAAAVSIINVTYMISIKRFSIIFGIIFGRFFFNEKNTPVRLTGGLIMIIGAALITLRST